MGANASTAVPLYASGQVLDAARLNLTNNGIPVFSGTATRDAAFGGSGEKVLAEGQFAYLEDTNALQFYDSAAWQSVGAVSLVASGTFSGVASFNVDNVFTSTYRNYRILVQNTQTTGAAAQIISTQLRTGGTASTTGYYFARSGYAYTGTIAADVGANLNYWFLQRSNGSASIDGEGAVAFDLFSPALAVRTFFTGTHADGSYSGGMGGYHNVETAYDGVIFATTTGATTMSGEYRIYGYKD